MPRIHKTKQVHDDNYRMPAVGTTFHSRDITFMRLGGGRFKDVKTGIVYRYNAAKLEYYESE